MSEEAFIYEAIRTPRGKNKNGVAATKSSHWIWWSA